MQKNRETELQQGGGRKKIGIRKEKKESERGKEKKERKKVE